MNNRMWDRNIDVPRGDLPINDTNNEEDTTMTMRFYANHCIYFFFAYEDGTYHVHIIPCQGNDEGDEYVFTNATEALYFMSDMV